MGIMRQCGDHVCLCEHHGAAYVEVVGTADLAAQTPKYFTVADAAVLEQVQITTTETCCIVVNAAVAHDIGISDTDLEIERPFGTIRTTQESMLTSGSMKLLHHAAWEVLPPGTYTYYLVNRSGAAKWPWAVWMKAIASDCEG